ncbi:phenylalanyl-tRNA synthetase alpha subunit, mitochondrial [Marasmius crinis-equi]|uniref:phenylalanine--tRNA ligase n=1 Tax=Marasmius crinis-equi TaxID=585013 RepID=A0ABR3G1L2_9AGAR
MAQPSSSHHDDHRRHRSERSSSHHHHRTISSTTLLLVLSLVLALLAVLLSFNSSNSPFLSNFNNGHAAQNNPEAGEDKGSSGVWGMLTPKRTKELIGREKDVALREAEVARREAEILAGAPGGVITTPSPAAVCQPCIAATTVETVVGPIQTVIKEIVKEDSLTPPGWASPRIDEILDRELKVAEREREISKREEGINRREHDAARRESWIMEQLIALGNGEPQTVEEEHIYEQAMPPKRKAKYKELPPLVISQTQIETRIETVTATETIQVPQPHSIRQVATPAPAPVDAQRSTAIPRTTAVEIIHEVEEPEEEEEEEYEEQVTYKRGPPRRPPARWFGGCAGTGTGSSKYPPTIEILGQHHPTDEITNITPAIISKLPLRLHTQPAHPLCTLRSLIESHFNDFTHLPSPSPLVTPFKNFDELAFPKDHPGRSVTDSYYVNKDLMLRTHTSAHEVEVFRDAYTRWLLTADVYRRDEIDGSHYPVFHQMEGAKLFDAAGNGMKEVEEDNQRLERFLSRENIVIEDIPHISPTNPVQKGHDPVYAEAVTKNLKLSLNSLMLTLFGGQQKQEEPLRVRWIEAYFPFTSPSFEVEVFFRGKWLEILGCGVVKQSTLDTAGVQDKIGWAFGLGLERIAMILYSIPDIRLFWSQDPRFISQFKAGEITTFKTYSKYPSCFKDVSFWSAQNNELHENDFCDLVRDVAGDLVEDVQKIDNFVHPKTKRISTCYRINYRSMDRSLSNEEANEVQQRVNARLKSDFGVEIR